MTRNLCFALARKISFFYLTLCWLEWCPWYVDSSSDGDPTWLRWGNNKQEELVVNQETGESMMRIQLLEQGTPYHLILNKYWTLQNLTLLSFKLEQFRDHFYTRDPPGRLGNGLGFALNQSIAEQGASTSFMLQVRAIPRPLLLFGPPHGGWQKWSRICCILKHKKVRAMAGNSNLVGGWHWEFPLQYWDIHKSYFSPTYDA